MTDLTDDELLGDEDELDDNYDITNEREEALLQEDDEFITRKELESYDEPDALDLGLDLDIDEDFEEEDKLLYDDDEPEEKSRDHKFHSEKPPQNQNNTQTKPLSTTSTPETINRPAPPTNSFKPVPQQTQKVNNAKKQVVRNDKRRRGNGRNFQTRQNFTKNNVQRRRNGTVLINPRYEGTVHINESNARLAWDTLEQSQTNPTFVQPWSSGNSIGSCDPNLLVNNIITGIANSFTHPNVLMSSSQPQNGNFYEPPPNYEPPLAFEPPPRVNDNRNNTQKPYNQVNHHYTHPMPIVSGPPPAYNSYSNYNNVVPKRIPTLTHANTDQDFRSKRPTDVDERYDKTFSKPPPCYDNKNFNYSRTSPNVDFNKPFGYDNKNFDYNKSSLNADFSKPPPNYDRVSNFNKPSQNSHINNYPQKNDYQNKNGSYTRMTNYQNKNSNYNNSNYKNDDRSYNNYISSNDGKSNFSGPTENQLFKHGNYFKTNQMDKTEQNNASEQGQYRQNFGDQRSLNVQTNSTQQNVPRQAVKQPPKILSAELKKELPEKKARFNEPEQKETVPKPGQPAEEMVDSEYLRKIEEQRRERERILKMKEERRKQQIEQRLQQEKQVLAPPPVKQNVPELNESHQNIQKQSQGSHNIPKQNQGHKSVPKQNQVCLKAPMQNQSYQTFQFDRQNFPNAIQTCSANQSVQNSGLKQPVTFSNSFANVGSDFSRSDSDLYDDLNLTFKVTNNAHTNVPKNSKVVTSSGGFMSNRVVVVKSKNQNSETPNSDVKAKPVESSEGQGLSSFFNSRKVLKKDSGLVNTRLVVVNNLSTSVTQDKLMALSRGIGEIEKLRVDKQERQATILFKCVASAHAFFKKYQRRILDDLSVIECNLEPML